MQFRIRTLFAITLAIAVILGLMRPAAYAAGMDTESVALICLFVTALSLAPLLGIIALSRLVNHARNLKRPSRDARRGQRK